MAKAEKGSTELVEKKAGALMAPSFMDESDLNGGFEGADKDSFAIPFLYILQKMSPQVDEEHSKYIDGAKAGMLMNTVTNDLYDGKGGLELVLCAFKRSFIEWGARKAGGGFKAEWTPEQALEMIDNGSLVQIEGKVYRPGQNGEVDVEKDNYVADTRTHFVLIKTEMGFEPAIFPLSSTQIKASKGIMAALGNLKVEVAGGRKATPPTYASVIKATTASMQNDKGSWSALKMERSGWVTDAELFTAARLFKEQIVKGDVKADFAKNAEHEAGSVDSAAPADADKF